MKVTRFEGVVVLVVFALAIYGLFYQMVWEHELAHAAVWRNCGVENASVKVTAWLAGSTDVLASQNESDCARPYNNLNEIVSYNLGNVFQLLAVGFFFIGFLLVMQMRED